MRGVEEGRQQGSTLNGRLNQGERRDRCGNKGSRLVVKKQRETEREARQQRAVEALTREGCGGQKREDVHLGSRKKWGPRRSREQV